MASLNRVFLVGNLTRDPDCRYTAGGKAVGNFGLALNHRYHNAAGEEREESCFVEIEVVGELAEKMREQVGKGSLVYVEGRLRLAAWKDKRSGKKRHRLKVTARQVQALKDENR